MSRRARLKVSYPILVEWVRGHDASRVTSTAPDDLRIVGVLHDDPLGEAITFVVESASFEDQPEMTAADDLPDWTPLLTRHDP